MTTMAVRATLCFEVGDVLWYILNSQEVNAVRHRARVGLAILEVLL